MGSRKRAKMQRHGERGATLYMVVAFLFILIGIGALAVDLASMFVARSQAQRAADSAALAGAKVFVESGCVTSGDCTSQETTATARATQAALQNYVEGQAVTVQSVSFTQTARNPQITVQVQSANLRMYFAGAVGITSSPNVAATATAEAYNPSGAAGGPTFCTGCVRPWLIPNCDALSTYTLPPSTLCGGQASLLDLSNNYSVSKPSCTPTGVIGAQIDIRLATQSALYGAVDVDSPALGNPADYQQAITTCFTGQATCGVQTFTPLPPIGSTNLATIAGVETILHIATTGMNSQDTIDTTVCPPQIHAGALNPLVTQRVVNVNDVIATSDSIVTAYIWDGQAGTQLRAGSQPVNIVGFAQIFVTQVDANGDVEGVILGVAGCGSAGGGACNSSAIQGATMLPVRLITPAS